MTKAHVEIDGSKGEGGGQMLRSALALSMATGRPFVMSNLRAGRVKPGLMRQHLSCVTAAASICGGQVGGAQVGSMRVEFVPGVVKSNSYRVAIGSAGSTIMVLQAVLPAMLRSKEPSRIVVEGGTHNTKAPSYEFFANALVPLMSRMGGNIACSLEKRGFYPAGGGRVVVDIQPCEAVSRLEIMERGERVRLLASAEVSNLRHAIAERELDVMMQRLQLNADQMRTGSHRDSLSPGNVVSIHLTHANVSEVFVALGEIGKTAEAVAKEVCDGYERYVASDVPVGEYLADQLMVPMALMGGGSFVTGPLTLHSLTNIEVMRMFGVPIEHTKVSNGVRVDVGLAPERE